MELFLLDRFLPLDPSCIINADPTEEGNLTIQEKFSSPDFSSNGRVSSREATVRSGTAQTNL